MSGLLIGLFCFGTVVTVIAAMILIAVARIILRGFRNDD